MANPFWFKGQIQVFLGWKVATHQFGNHCTRPLQKQQKYVQFIFSAPEGISPILAQPISLFCCCAALLARLLQLMRAFSMADLLLFLVSRVLVPHNWHWQLSLSTGLSLTDNYCNASQFLGTGELPVHHIADLLPVYFVPRIYLLVPRKLASVQVNSKFLPLVAPSSFLLWKWWSLIIFVIKSFSPQVGNPESKHFASFVCLTNCEKLTFVRFGWLIQRLEVSYMRCQIFVK